jgi:hypothetical protein
VKKIYSLWSSVRACTSAHCMFCIVDTHFHHMAHIFLSQILSGVVRYIRRCDLAPYFFCFFSDFGPSCGLGIYFMLFTPHYFLYLYFVLFLYASGLCYPIFLCYYRLCYPNILYIFICIWTISLEPFFILYILLS